MVVEDLLEAEFYLAIGVKSMHIAKISLNFPFVRIKFRDITVPKWLAAIFLLVLVVSVSLIFYLVVSRF